ncbi:MAG: phytanoyl-CoA dioxygenase family protein [candidate division Zixibacteria bacterium]|nr:phytanoyl-CoA dioxygenase family protein [candidate division Zixibacteria bacterium]
MPFVDLDFFKANGYVILDDALTQEETTRFTALYDRDRAERWYNWRLIGPNSHQTVNCDPLITTPEIDDFIRHPGILEPIRQIMGGPVCVSETCFRHIAPYDGTQCQHWHRDRTHDLTHPLRTAYVHAMVYLTDVHEKPHCFSISPEAYTDPILDADAQLAKRGSVDIYGPAGTVVLFNLSVLHTATARPTSCERKTLQTYYGHRDGPVLSHNSTLPARLWRDHPDPEVLALYGNLNEKSRLYTEAFETRNDPP